MLVAKGRPAVLTVEVRDFDAILCAPDAAPTVVITDVDGTTVSTGTATATDATGIYTYTVPSAVTCTLGVYTAEASFDLSGEPASVSYALEVVGEYLFEINEIRDRDHAITESSYPAGLIRAARESATDAIETAAQVAFSKRASRAILSGDGTSTLLLPDVEVAAILACIIYDEETGTDTADEVTGDELIDVEVNRETGVVTRTDGQVFPVGSNNVLIDYEHGYDRVPAPVREAAITLAIEYLVPSALPARATAQATDLGDFRISVANIDLGRDTGIPAVDSVIQQFGRRRPRLG